MSIYSGERPTTAQQHRSQRYRETHDGSLPMTTASERRGGGGDGNGGPSGDEVMERAREYQQFWTTTHAQMQIDRELYTLSSLIEVPDGYNTVRPSTGNTVVLTLADHVAGDRPQVKVPEANLTKKASRRSERMEKWVQAALPRFFSQAPVSQVRSAIINFGWAGMAVSQGPLFMADAWGEEPERAGYDSMQEYEDDLEDYNAQKRTTWPFHWRMVDPRFVFLDPGSFGKETVIVHYQRTAGSIKRQWREWSMRRPNGGTPYRASDLVDWYEFWDESHRVYMAGGEVLDSRRHRYGKPQFQIRAAGFGEESGEPHEIFRSLLFPARSMIRQQIRAWCQLDAVMRKAAWTHMLTTENSAFQGIIPGHTSRLKPEDIELTKPVTELRGEVIQALLQEIALIGGSIEEATYPRVVGGDASATKVNSGYGVNSLAALGKIKFGTVAVAAEGLLSEFVSDLFHCVENVVEEPVPVWGDTKRGWVDLELGPDDIDGYYYNIISLNPKMPIDRANEIQIGSVLYRDGEGVIDSATYLQDFAGYEQPEEMLVRVQKERIMRLPAVQQIMGLAALEETGMLDFIVAKAKEWGLPVEALLTQLGILQPPPAPPTLGPGAGGPGGAAPNGGGVAPAAPGAPGAQAEPMPGSLRDQGAITSQSEAARGAGVPPPGAA